MMNVLAAAWQVTRERRLLPVILAALQFRANKIADRLDNLRFRRASPYYHYLRSRECWKDNTAIVDEDFHSAVVDRVIVSYKKAKLLQPTMPLPYQVVGEWARIVDSEFQEFIGALDDNAKSKRLLSNLCRSRLSRGLELGADYMRFHKRGFDSQYINNYLKQLHTWKVFVDDSESLESLSFPLIGNPFGPIIEGHLIPKCTIRHHYYATRLGELSASIEKPIICEIGGGFGGMAYHLLRNSDKPVKYIDLDIPEILALASYFLLIAFPDKKTLLFGEENFSPSSFASNDVILMPNFELPRLVAKSVDIVFNSDSLIEMDERTVIEYISQIGRISRRLFIHNNHNHGEESMIHSGKPSSKFKRITRRYLEGTSFKRVYAVPALLQPEYFECLYERREGNAECHPKAG